MEVGKVIDKFRNAGVFAGDGMMVFFNDPVPCGNHAERPADQPGNTR